MATVLENYYGYRQQLLQRMAKPPISPADLWIYGEIQYRIGVLETCQMYLRSAPITREVPCLQGHYMMLDAYVQNLARERRYGPNRGPDTQKERDAAQVNLERVIQDYRKRFTGFQPAEPEAYQKEIGRVITTLLPAWLQRRAPEKTKTGDAVPEHLCAPEEQEGGEQVMNDGKQAALSAIQKINAVEGFDPTPLAVEYVDLNTQEKRSRLPVMAQLAWFRLKYPEGRVAVAVTAAKDCFVATARVYPSYTNPPEQYLSEATASRGYQADKPTVSPREWAQTAAIGIALRNAGFGLQFSAAGDSFDSPAVDELGGIIWSGEDDPQTPLSADMPPAAAPVATQSPAEPVDPLEKAMNTLCPISKYKGRTLGQVLREDPRAILWVATKFTGDPEVSAAAKLICEQSVEQSA